MGNGFDLYNSVTVQDVGGATEKPWTLAFVSDSMATIGVEFVDADGSTLCLVDADNARLGSVIAMAIATTPKTLVDVMAATGNANSGANTGFYGDGIKTPAGWPIDAAGLIVRVYTGNLFVNTGGHILGANYDIDTATTIDENRDENGFAYAESVPTTNSPRKYTTGQVFTVGRVAR